MVSQVLHPVVTDGDLTLRVQVTGSEMLAPALPSLRPSGRSGRSSSSEIRMPVTLEQFTQLLNDSGLLSAEDMDDVRAGLPQYETVEALAENLYRRNKLTKYQLTRVIQGKAKSLHLGNYTVLDKIGQGGMGLVVKAKHRVMQRIVAIKVLSASTVKSPDAVKRFHREVEAAARLNHPHIVAAFDADQSNGTHFLVMEYVDGYDLAALIRMQGTLSVRRAIEFMLQAGRGLEFIHTHGVVHRDIKPSNLLIDRAGVVRILDMGLARLENSEQATDLTSSGQIMGTIDYMAPEQAVNTRTADHRADIYSFGCTLWYLLTGRSVYDGETAMAKLLEHRDRAIPSLLGINAELQTTNPRAVAIDRVIRKMLAKHPDQRYQSMAEVLMALEGCRSAKTESPEAPPALPSEAEEPLTAFLSSLSSGADPEKEPGLPLVSPPIPATIDLNVLNQDSTPFALLSGMASACTVLQRPPRSRNPVWIAVAIGGVCLLAIVWAFSGGNSPTPQPVTPVATNSEQKPPPTEAAPVEPTPAPPVHPAGQPNGQRNTQLAFNGTDSYVQVESLQYEHGQPYTCEGWFTPLGTPHAVSDPLIWSGPSWIALWEQNRVFGVGLTGTGPTAILATRPLEVRQPLDRESPVHVAGVWKGKEQRLFVNGRRVELANTNASAFPETTGGLFLGGAPWKNIGHSRWYRGGIDEVRISRGTRYTSNFEPERRFPDADPETLALYHFDEMSGETAADSSGHNHHGTVVNAKWIPAPARSGFARPNSDTTPE